jgi:hypothetical protein
MDNFLVMYTKDTVDNFVNFRLKSGTEPLMVDKFFKSHTIEQLTEWLDLFPPPSIYEIWDRWIKLRQNGLKRQLTWTTEEIQALKKPLN